LALQCKVAPHRRSHTASEGLHSTLFQPSRGAPVVVPEGWRRRPPGRSGPFPAQATKPGGPRPARAPFPRHVNRPVRTTPPRRQGMGEEYQNTFLLSRETLRAFSLSPPLAISASGEGPWLLAPPKDPLTPALSPLLRDSHIPLKLSAPCNGNSSPNCHPPASRRRDRGTQYSPACLAITGWPGQSSDQVRGGP
jgi:hypothetical protein